MRPERYYYDHCYGDSDKNYTSRGADDLPYLSWNNNDSDSEIWNLSM